MGWQSVSGFGVAFWLAFSAEIIHYISRCLTVDYEHPGYSVCAASLGRLALLW